MASLGKTIILVCMLLCSGCTLNFKAKELELEAQPPLTYRLNGIQLAGLEVYHGPD